MQRRCSFLLRSEEGRKPVEEQKGNTVLSDQTFFVKGVIKITAF